MELARDQLLTCLRIDRWATALEGRDFPDADALVAEAMGLAESLAESEIDEALSAHPRIGERAAGTGADADFSTREQADSQDPDEALAQRLHEGNEEYERRFGRVFLIRAAGRSRADILAELDRRLLNDEATELDEVAEQLRQIAELRLRQTWEDA